MFTIRSATQVDRSQIRQVIHQVTLIAMKRPYPLTKDFPPGVWGCEHPHNLD